MFSIAYIYKALALVPASIFQMTKNTFRMSVWALVIRIAVPLAMILIYAPFTPDPLFTIWFLGIPFSLIAFYIWSANTLEFHDDELILHRWFVLAKRTYDLRALSDVRLHTEKELFMSEPWLELVFKNNEPIVLMSMNKSDLNEILNRLQTYAPRAISTKVHDFADSL